MYSSRTHPLRHARLHVAEEWAIYDAARPRVYLDTSIPSYLTGRTSGDLIVARRQRITRIWWEQCRDQHSLYISERVLAEASAGDATAAKARLDSLEGLEALDTTEQSDALASHLLSKGLFPAKARADAEHLSIAVANSVAILLTWNCKHLANSTIYGEVVRTCEMHSFRCPDIFTPEQLMRGHPNGRSTT